jgi:hypothetical protein
LARSQWRALVRQERALIEPEITRRFQQAHRTLQRSHQQWAKYERYCALQRELLRDLDRLNAQERAMYELDNSKDQLMSVCKVALANLLMWVRDRFFGPDYAHATAERLLPFLRLPGRVLTFDDQVLVTLRPFNDRRLNRDLADFCARVNQAHCYLPDGKSLCFRVADSCSVLSGANP